ncbi:MAG: hypothetical protein ACYC6Y_31830, partial [Thermoguttaceae bacterium]
MTGNNILDRLLYVDQLQEKQKAATPQPTPPGAAATAAQPAQPQPAFQPPAPTSMTVDQMLQQAMTLPAGTAVAGRSVTLLDLMGQVTERAKRLEIAHAYWQLVRLLAEYRFCWEESQQIQSIGLGRIDANLLDSAQRAADRELTAMEVAVLTAQYELAEAAALDESGQLPVPVDRPHVGIYNTNFEEIFAESTPPGQTRLLHRTLPLQHQAIGIRTEAIEASQAALQAVAQSYQAGQVDAADLLAALHEITVHKRAWITAIVHYNHSIADYALAIAGPETSGRKLVSILIKLAQSDRPTGGQAAASPTASAPGQWQRADGAFSPAAPGETGRQGVPTLAPPSNPAAEFAAESFVPPVPTDEAPRWDPAVEPASGQAPSTAAGQPPSDSAVAPAVAQSPASEPRDAGAGSKLALPRPPAIYSRVAPEPPADDRDIAPPWTPPAAEKPVDVP